MNFSGTTLYLTYDGILEPLGQSQVLRYLEQLSLNRKIILISFEKSADWHLGERRKIMREQLRATGIVWMPLRYHKRPSAFATAYDIVQGLLAGTWVVCRYRVTIVHARSYVPSVMAFTLKKIFHLKIIFDMRGFWADERIEGGLWPRSGRMYKLAKWFERRFLLNADHVVSLTHSAAQIIQSFDYLQGRLPPLTVIPTCADLNRFKPVSHEFKPPPFVLGYVGTVGTWYLFDEVVACVAILLRMKPEAQFLVVNRGEHDYIRQRLQAAGVPESASEIRSVTNEEVPALMARMHAGIFFIKPAFSKQASAPTKLAEFLGCGIPCLGNAGVGDMATVLEGERVGVVINSFEESSLQQGLKQLLSLSANPEITGRCVAAAHKHFSLDEGVARYQAIYESLDKID